MNYLTMVVIFLNVVAAHAAPVDFKISPEDGQTDFVATGRPAMLKIHGKSKGPIGAISIDDKNVTGTIELSLDQLSTGIDLRDEHMKEKYLEVQKFPKAVLKLNPLALPPLMDGQTAQKVPFTGDLTLHGVTHAVTGNAEISRKGEEYVLSANYGLHLSDFKIDIPTYLGIKVADDVSVAVEFKAKR